MAFHETRFPDNISRGARGGPERRTQIGELASGDEERNASWADSRRRYDVAYGIRKADDLAAVIAFFEARGGHASGGPEWRRPALRLDCGHRDRDHHLHRGTRDRDRRDGGL